ncbi:hypothetical protein DBADOPDK_00501 [Pseudomonas sp. MM223]|nr:hypothetical protein DBADOPDK_00501 [Pseudomonas sp. MM223]
MSLEVGRIIRGFETPSTLNFKKLKYKEESPYEGHQALQGPRRTTPKTKRGGLPASPLLYSYTCKHSLSLERNPRKRLLAGLAHMGSTQRKHEVTINYRTVNFNCAAI